MSRCEKLNSDRVNYLIWRYLQEAGFAQTAARLQQDWPLQGRKPEDFYFSKNIQPRALIQLLQYGLKYHRVAIDSKPNTPPFFGPEPESGTAFESVTTTIPANQTKSSSPAQQYSASNDNASTSLTAPSSTSKPRNRRTNGTSAISSAKSSRAAGTTSAAVTGGVESMDVDQSTAATTNRLSNDGMEIDGEEPNIKSVAQHSPTSITSPTRNGDHGAAANEFAAGSIPEQQHIPSPIPTPTLTNGTSIGIQSEDIISLAQRTTVIETDERVKTIHHLEWNPTSPTYLAIAGQQLGQVWQIAKDKIKFGDAAATTASATKDHGIRLGSQTVAPKSVHNLNGNPNATVTSIAWSPEGKRLLYSVLEETAIGTQYSCIKIHNGQEDLVLDDGGSSLVGAVTKLAWNPDGDFIAGFTAGKVFIQDVNNNIRLLPVDTGHDLMDLIWVSNDRLIVCGASCIASIRMDGPEAGIEFNFDRLAESADWSILRWNPGTSTIALASESTGEVAIIESPERCSRDTGHGNSVTDLVYHPNSDNGMFATASEDGTVCIWESKPTLSKLQTLVLDGVSTPACVAFSTDGNVLAAADWDKVFFWNWQKDTKPAFVWEAKNVAWPSTRVNGHPANGTNGYSHDHAIDKSSTGDEPPVLRWTANRLTFAYENKIAIIDVPV